MTSGQGISNRCTVVWSTVSWAGLITSWRFTRSTRGLATHDGLYRSAMAGTGTLRKVERELIAYVVSLENHCHY